MPKISELNRSALIECPNCRLVAEADPIQLVGHCSLICPQCGFHWYITPKVNGVAQVVEGARAKLVE